MRQWTTFVVLSAIAFVGVSRQTNAGDEPTPHSIIDRALKAGGGVEKISQFKAVSFKAELTGNGSDAKVQLSGVFAGPSLFRMEMEIKDERTYVFVGGGDTFWVKKGKGAFEETHAGKADDFAAVEAVVRLFYGISLPDQLLGLKSKGYKLTILGDQAVNGVQAVAMRVDHQLHPEVMIYFDKETGLPVKTQLKFPPPKDGLAKPFFKPGDELVEVFFDNYKEVDGVKHFTTFKIRTSEETMECELRELKLLKKVDSGKFKKPA
jgi:hypothetical protein